MCTGSYKFFENKSCSYFPCHKHPSLAKGFNCLFCYCPLTPFSDCGGSYDWIDESKGLKDCSRCILPHKPESYDYIIAKLMSRYSGMEE